jgi:hypothetical protein
MRATSLLIVLLGCRAETAIRPEVIAAGRPKAPVVQAVEVSSPIVGHYVVPKHVARRKAFAVFPLTAGEHGVDGTLELWREERVDDALVEKTWGAFSYESFATWSPDRSGWPLSAQVVIKDASGKLVASEDLLEPSAKLALVRAGEPYFELSIDTATGEIGTTQRFFRVVEGRARWLKGRPAHTE